MSSEELKKRNKRKKPKLEISENDFKDEVLSSSLPVLVMFWGSWCPVCKQAQPMLEQFDDEIDGVKIKMMNIDRNPHTATKYEVMGTPNFCLFKDGILINRRFGSQSKKQLLQMIKRVL